MTTPATATAPKHPQVKVRLSGRDGNAMNLIALCRVAARKAGLPDAEIEAFQSKAMSGDYSHLLRVCAEYFDCR